MMLALAGALVGLKPRLMLIIKLHLLTDAHDALVVPRLSAAFGLVCFCVLLG